jgi:hypothetical protein
MGAVLLDLPESVKKLKDMHGFHDDFLFYTTVHNGWTTVASDSGSITANDAAGGTITLNPSDGSVGDNDEVYLKRTQETFLMAAGKPISIGTSMKFSEANTDDANIWFGVKDALAANSLVDDGAGMATSFSGFGFFKQDGQTLWSIIASLSATQTIVQLTATNSLDKTAHTAGSTAFQRLECEFRPNQGGKADICYFIDGTLVYKISGFDYANATEMQLGFGAKNGDTNAEAPVVDWAYGYQGR